MIVIDCGVFSGSELGEVIGYDTSAWGTSHIVIAGGQIHYVTCIHDAGSLGIGARMATPRDIELYS